MMPQASEATAAAATAPFRLVCPDCRSPLRPLAPDVLACDADGVPWSSEGGIWRMLSNARATRLQAFVQDYESVRRAEGRGSEDAEFYLRLPFDDTTGRFVNDWRIRAASYRALIGRVLRPAAAAGGALRVLDLGAGNGWLAHRLAVHGHHVAAVDLLVNDYDGLGAHVKHRTGDAAPVRGSVLPVQAEFDRLPFADAAADVVIFNGSLHYSTNIEATLTEALRVLNAAGRIVIMDSPIYRDGRSGEQMVREREAAFVQRYGFASNALPSEHFLTRHRLRALEQRLELRWRWIQPFYGWRWALRPWTARVLARREPARFAVLAGART